ncbi:hypothetical protein R3P38DRAFT_3298882 [Favolaschia claudopus]|uniref:Uncharacterized protein n=1 Tax=Favolaschia claudopus TaxID=2862362 RepID=A0AAV9Z2H9_9AGAR
MYSQNHYPNPTPTPAISSSSHTLTDLTLEHAAPRPAFPRRISDGGGSAHDTLESHIGESDSISQFPRRWVGVRCRWGNTGMSRSSPDPSSSAHPSGGSAGGGGSSVIGGGGRTGTQKTQTVFPRLHVDYRHRVLSQIRSPTSAKYIQELVLKAPILLRLTSSFHYDTVPLPIPQYHLTTPMISPPPRYLAPAPLRHRLASSHNHLSPARISTVSLAGVDHVVVQVSVYGGAAEHEGRQEETLYRGHVLGGTGEYGVEVQGDPLLSLGWWSAEDGYRGVRRRLRSYRGTRMCDGGVEAGWERWEG